MKKVKNQAMENSITVAIPKEIANLQLPDPQLKLYYENLDNRVIWLDMEIDDSCLDLVRYIMAWNAEDKDVPVEDRVPIRILFFSPGGDLDVCYSLFDAIKMSTTPIYGINIGRCCSAAAYIYLACHKRYMLKHSYFLFHQGSSNMSGEYSQLISAMEDYQNQVEELSHIMKENTNYTEEEILSNITSEWYVRRDEAIEKGVCHKIINNISEV